MTTLFYLNIGGIITILSFVLSFINIYKAVYYGVKPRSGHKKLNGNHVIGFHIFIIFIYSF